jgi:hypothetical protein
MCVSYGLWIHWFRDLDATIPNGSVTIGRMLLVGVGHSGLDSMVSLMLRTVCYVIKAKYCIFGPLNLH